MQPSGGSSSHAPSSVTTLRRRPFVSQAEPHLQEVPFPILEEFEDAGPLVGILIGSESDQELIEPAAEELNERGISNELRILSAHRDPRGVAEYGSTAALRGVRAIIAIVQMPPGVPVACVSLNGARNAAILAAKILAQGGGYPAAPRSPAQAS